ncbi:hypothetical protein [Deinococcus sp. QL22]|uniref:hypothetical protein n=1 Tax=Deinococcus sp. QL22 TaxID=2939437 RepID=UPI002016D357|nr:hypothetical protein [Deinococcus sp. QL22]UQN06634.1 hypothetical protein M1R55_01540 [Deinococcus sp. QL22]
MRFLVVVLALVVGLVYFFFGLRLGYVTLTPTRMLNAQGENNYVFNVFDSGQSVGVTGTCSTVKGRAVLRLYDPSGTQIAGQACPKGQWALQVLGKGDAGNYRLNVQFNHFTGLIDLKETRNSGR